MEEGTIFQPTPQGSLRAGVLLNGMFEIERLIAQGGMGEVYKGVAVASGDPVAIKLVRPEMARNPDVMALFKREAAILHNLLHDAIPRYYVFSVEPELQRAYIAMEFVDGMSLQKRLVSGPLTSAEVRVLLRRIGAALDLAHANGVVHRDISSDNIILPGGDPRRAKVVDFGIARDAQASEGTIIGDGFAGKYKYVSPEQLGLFGGVATAKSDIYSFGLVIAEALRGRAIDMGSTQADVIEKRKRVPDISDIDPSLRSLLSAMLAPNPEERPSTMAEVAAWGETGERTQVKPAPAPVARKGGAVAAAATAVVVLALAGAGYLLRDRLREAVAPLLASSPTPSASATAPPILPPKSATTTPTPPPPPATTPTPATPTSPTPTPPQATDIMPELPPKAPQDELALKAVGVGAQVLEELPAFMDPGGKGLALHATAPLPPGLQLHDRGGGRSVLEGTASAAGRFAFDVVAITHNGKSARMKVTLDVAAAPPAQATPPAPATPDVRLEPATVGAPYSAGLPPFRSAEKITLRAERLPEGLVFADLGGGLSQISGAPAKPGSYDFDVIAAAPGGEGRMRAHVDVAPAPPPPATLEPSPSPSLAATPSGAEQAAVFLDAYGAGPCFLARFEDRASDPLRFVVLGDDRAAFETFDADVKRVLARDADLRAELVTRGQCPVVEFMKKAAAGASPPRLALDRVAVGADRPLSGAITELAKRKLVLLAIGDDGRAVKVRADVADDGQSASFSLSMTGDAASFGKPQLLLAIASDRPLASLESFRAGPSAALMRDIEDQGRQGGVAAAVALFKLVN